MGIINNYYFACETCNDGKKYCKTCRGKGKSIHEHKLTKFEIEEEKPKEEENDQKKKLDNLLDEKFEVAVDSLIAGKIPTKFHYSKVSKQEDNNELTDDMLLYLDDKTLNKYLPLKALAPYRDGYVVPGYKKKRLLNEFQREVDKKKRDILNEMKQKKDIEESNKSFLQKKRNLNNDNNNKKSSKGGDKDDNKEFTNKGDFRKKKRMETYGLADD